MKHVSTFLGLLFLVIGTATGDEPARSSANLSSATAPDRAAKPPWDWTIDERLSDRFNPEKIHERELAYRARYPQAAGSSDRAITESSGTSERQPFVHGIDGSRNPELFFPYELFDGLVTGLSPNESMRVKQRAYLRKSIRARGYDDEVFWDALESVSAKYLPLRFGKTYPAPPAEIEAAAVAKCRERYDALEAARVLFGRRRFDVLLYTVMAPVSQFSEATFDADPSAKHRRADKGCR